MSRFSETLMDHFQDPRHLGRMKNPDAIGVAGVLGVGRHLVLYLKVDRNRVTEAWFECQGCGVTIACGSVLTELLDGRSLAECERLTAADIVHALDGIPYDKQDRAEMPIFALREALQQYRSNLDPCRA